MNITGPIPENIRRCMPKEVRADIGQAAMTNADAEAKHDGKREKQLQENIAALLRQRNIWFARQRMDKRATGTLGTPDFLFAVNGRACAFEVKIPRAKPTAEQIACHVAMMKNGWFVRVVTSEVEALQQLEVVSHG